MASSFLVATKEAAFYIHSNYITSTIEQTHSVYEISENLLPKHPFTEDTYEKVLTKQRHNR